MFKALTFLLSFLTIASAEVFGDYDKTQKPADFKTNMTTGGPYTYSQSAHHFWGMAYDGSNIDTTGCCCGTAGSCRNNPSCQCIVNVGPLPQGTYTLGNMFTYKSYPNSYQLFPSSSNNMCGRSDFLIHGGNCNSGKPLCC